MKTKMTELLQIQHPIMQGGMQWLGVPKLAAAVSEGGGLGTLNASCYPEEGEYRRALRELKSLTKRPVAVNISLTPETTIGEKTERNIAIAGEEGIGVIETAGRAPGSLREMIRKAGMIHIHKCTTLRHALHAEKAGVDMVALVGYEAAGHPSPKEIGGFVLFNEVSSALSIPVLAGGGVTDGKGLVAALALGAEGVVLGTRFVASEECWIHENFKQVILQVGDDATLTCQRNIDNMCRYYRNAQALKAVEAEAKGGGLEEMLPIVSGKLGKACYQSGDTEGCCFSIGEGAALIHDIKPAGDIIREIVSSAREIVESRLPSIVGA